MIQTFLCRVHDCRLYILSWNLSGWLRRLWLFSFWFLPFWELSSFNFSEWFNRDWKMSCCAWSHVWIIRRRGSVLSTKNVRFTRDWAIVSITARGNNKTTRWWSSEMKKKKEKKGKKVWNVPSTSQDAQAHYRNADATLACKRCCVTNGYLQRLVWDVNGFS